MPTLLGGNSITNYVNAKCAINSQSHGNSNDCNTGSNCAITSPRRKETVPPTRMNLQIINASALMSMYEYKWQLRNEFIQAFSEMANFILSAHLQGIPQEVINQTLANSGTVAKILKIGAEYFSLLTQE